MVCGSDLLKAGWNTVHSEVSERYFPAKKYGGKQAGEVGIRQVVSSKRSKQNIHITVINKTDFSVLI